MVVQPPPSCWVTHQATKGLKLTDPLRTLR